MTGCPDDQGPSEPAAATEEPTSSEGPGTTVVVSAGTEDGIDSSTAPGSSTDPGTDDGEIDVATDDGGEGGDDGPPPLNEPVLPSVTGRCPDLGAAIATGLTPVDVTVDPAEANARTLRIWIGDEAETMDGPVIFYWHGTGGDTNEAIIALGDPGIASVVAAGGIVIAPFADPAAGSFPWFLVDSNNESDLLVADEFIACAHEQVGIDPHRIHSAGFSAGGMHTVAMSWMRSNYLASVASYSGGEFGFVHPPDVNPDNLFSAMVIHGGDNDIWNGSVEFVGSSENYAEQLQAVGKFAMLCDHGQGHALPPLGQATLTFFDDHPWLASPSPYVEGFPGVFPPGYCWIP